VEPEREVESYVATGLDNALDLMEVVTAKMDKASVGQQAAGIERHPEVCRLSFSTLLFHLVNRGVLDLQRRFKVKLTYHSHVLAVIDASLHSLKGCTRGIPRTGATQHQKRCAFSFSPSVLQFSPYFHKQHPGLRLQQYKVSCFSRCHNASCLISVHCG
jgi:hypothetical protein